MFFAVFFIFLFLAVVYLLLMPIVICIDTTTDQYYLKFKGLVKASVEKHEEKLLRIKLKVSFFSFYFYPIEYKRSSRKKKKPVQGRERKRRVDIGKSLALLKSFRVKKIVLDIDTGDTISNAKLYPVFAFLNQNIGKFNINFQGRNQLVLYIENRPIRLLKSFINF